jgi:hypothetical protein
MWSSLSRSKRLLRSSMRSSALLRASTDAPDPAGCATQGAIPVHRMLIEKELVRGHRLEALGYYQALLRALIELLGMRHRPDRFDYGWRYVESELPADAQALIRRYAFVADRTALRQKSDDLGAELMRQLELVNASLPAGPPSP